MILEDGYHRFQSSLWLGTFCQQANEFKIRGCSAMEFKFPSVSHCNKSIMVFLGLSQGARNTNGFFPS